MTAGAVAEHLRASGQRVTRPRVAVFEALEALGGHRGVDEIAEALRQRGTPLPTTSVYNALDSLRTAELVVVAHHGPPRTLFEVAGPHHDHFVCERCGAILDVEPVCAGPPGRRDPVVEPVPGALLRSAQTTYRGLCPRCASAP